MKSTFQIALYVIFCCLIQSCTMNEVAIYEQYDPVTPFEKFPYKVLFTSSEENAFWGINNNACKTVSFDTSNSFTGKNHLHIKWDQSKCKYIGLGLKWGNYKPKNLLPIIKSSALELRVRVDSGVYSKLPMFFILVDYNDKQCRTKINYLDLEGGQIDTKWRTIRIPFQAFNYLKKGVNISNIKELRLEFQRKGDIHIDNIIIVEHEYNYTKSTDDFTKVFDNHPINLGVGKEYWWGINPKYSSSFSFGKSFENESIVVQLDKFNGSTWNNFGFSPYKWMRTDISLIYSTSALTFKIKASEIPKLRTSFIAYTGQRRRLQKVLDESHFVKRNVNNYEAYIPLKSLVGHTEFRWDELKEVRFIILNDIPFEIGDFKIIEFRGNPKKPTEWKGI